MNERTIRVATINAFINRTVALAQRSADASRVAVLRFEPDVRVDRDFGRLSCIVADPVPQTVTLYSMSAEQFAGAVRRRHPAVSAWATTMRLPDDWSEEIRLDLCAMPSGTRLNAALRATKNARTWAVRVA
jgi:hypothetical protein